LVFTNLYHHICDVDNLRACYDKLEADKATGVDGVTKEEYGKNLEENLRDLSGRLRRIRMVQLQMTSSQRLMQLEEALGRSKQLRGLLRICSYCKKICDNKKQWHQIEPYITERSEVQFTHGICPECNERIIKPQL